MAGPTLVMKKRLLALLVIFTFVVVSLSVWIGYIQIVQGEWLQKEAFIQQNQGRTISPKRGTIYDRNGKELAISATVYTITCTPKTVRGNVKKSDDRDQKMRNMATELANILGMDPEVVLAKFEKISKYEIVKKKVEKDVSDQILTWMKENKIDGIHVDEDTKRYYPNRNLASHIIGFTGTDNEGLFGVELTMEKYLKGLPGRVLSEVDAHGDELPFKPEKRIDPQDGLHVVLTIDETIQYLATKTLEKAIEDYKVKRGAVAIVMDPRNGDVLALASKPDYDLNNPYAFPQGVEGLLKDVQLDSNTWKGNTTEAVSILNKTAWRNKAISDTYEPGSTFKTFTSAAGIEEGVVTPDTMTNDSPVEVGGWLMKCWRSGRLHGTETFREAVYNSCNPAFVKVALGLGVPKFYSYVRAFGFFDRTGLGLPGEQGSIFQKKPVEVDMAANSFGQRFTITPMQLITAYTAIANGGKLMKPRLVKELTDMQGNIVQKFEPEVVRTVISRQTSDTMRDILEGVVSVGTGKNAYVRGFRVAGKTGTSQTTEAGVYTASFCALAPADNPVVCVLIALFDPKGESHMGGAIAAPTAGKLVEDVLNYLQVERRYTEQDLKLMAQEVVVPDVRKLTVEDAIKKLKAQGLAYIVEGNGNNKNTLVMEQTPKPDAGVPQKSVVILYTYKPEKEVMVKMPNILNKTISEATEALNNAGLNIKVSGMGVAVNQSYEPGASVPRGQVVEVEFKHIDNVE